jgi:hypothetical protein
MPNLIVTVLTVQFFHVHKQNHIQLLHETFGVFGLEAVYTVTNAVPKKNSFYY